MKETVVVKTDLGEVSCSRLASGWIEGADRINKSVEKLRCLLEAVYPRSGLGGLQYDLYVYESEEINAFTVEEEDGFVIAFSTAVFIQFYRKLRNMFLVEEICGWFGTVPSKATNCVDAVYEYMIWFIAFHEFSHVINGHCKWLSEKGMFHMEILTERGALNNLISQIVEVDADYCGMETCVKFVFAQIIGLGAFDGKTDEGERRILMDAAKKEIIFLGFAVYHVFLLFSYAEKADGDPGILLKYDHPYASIRMAYSFLSMTYQLNFFLPVEEVVPLVNEVSRICIAYDRIYYAEGVFKQSLVSLAFTEKGVQHLMLLHNGWNDVVEELKKYACIGLERKEELPQAAFWVNEDGTMMAGG